jgi:hypothetical protein
MPGRAHVCPRCLFKETCDTYRSLVIYNSWQPLNWSHYIEVQEKCLEGQQHMMTEAEIIAEKLWIAKLRKEHGV